MTDWPSYNRSLVRRGEILFEHDFLDLWWDGEIEEMNEKKKGRKYMYPDSLILLLVASGFTFTYPIGKQKES